MKPTRIATLVAVAVAAGLVLWLVARVAYTSLPPLPWSTVATLLVLTAAELILARNVRARIQRRRGAPPPEALVVARYAVFAKASAYAAAVVAGAFGGILVDLLGTLVSPTQRSDAWVAAACLVSAAALCAAALLLEHACRVPKPPEERAETAHRR